MDRIARCPQVSTLCVARRASSTNDVALQLAAAGTVGLPALVLAEEQVRGRGRGSNRWWSAAGSLTFTWIVPPERYGVAGRDEQLVPLAVGVALCQAADRFLPASVRCALRWPNDVYLQGRKLAGILVERAGPCRLLGGAGDECERESRGEPAIVAEGAPFAIGVGINVTNSFDAAPAEVRERAIALCQVAGPAIQLTDVLIDCLDQLDCCLHLLKRDRTELLASCRRRLELTGRLVAVQQPGRRIEGLCCGIADDGALLVRSASGLARLLDGVVVEVQ